MHIAAATTSIRTEKGKQGIRRWRTHTKNYPVFCVAARPLPRRVYVTAIEIMHMNGVVVCGACCTCTLCRFEQNALWGQDNFTTR